MIYGAPLKMLVLLHLKHKEIPLQMTTLLNLFPQHPPVQIQSPSAITINFAYFVILFITLIHVISSPESMNLEMSEGALKLKL